MLHFSESFYLHNSFSIVKKKRLNYVENVHFETREITNTKRCFLGTGKSNVIFELILINTLLTLVKLYKV